MWSLLNVSTRSRLPEIMDQSDLEVNRHEHALRGLERINKLSRSARIFWSPLLELFQKLGRPIHLLDIATGGGDVPLQLLHWSQKNNLSLRVTGCDISPTALELARRNAKERKIELPFFQHDILRDPLPQRYDVITASLFLHHLDDQAAVTFLRRAAESANHLVLINDLRRSFLGLLTAYLATRLLTTSTVVHFDGPVSVRAAFTLAEAQALAEQAGLKKIKIVRRWPFRFLLSAQPG